MIPNPSLQDKSPETMSEVTVYADDALIGNASYTGTWTEVTGNTLEYRACVLLVYLVYLCVSTNVKVARRTTPPRMGPPLLSASQVCPFHVSFPGYAAHD